MLVKKLEEYETLLAIRERGRRRDVRVMGGAFLVLMLATTMIGLTVGLNGREVYLVVPVVGVLGLGYLTVWAKHAITKESIELVDTLKRAIGENPPVNE